MKTILLLLALVALSCSVSDAKSLQDANLWEDMHAILKDYHFQLPSDSDWRAEDKAELAQGEVFTASAYFVVDDPHPSTPTNGQMASAIRDAFRKLYGMDSGSRAGSDPSPPATAYFVWTNQDRGGEHRGQLGADESITLRVQVVTLPSAKLGIILSFVHVTPRATPKA